MISPLKAIISIHNSALTEIYNLIAKYKELINSRASIFDQIEKIQEIIKTKMQKIQIITDGL